MCNLAVVGRCSHLVGRVVKLRNVHTMSLAEFEKVFEERYFIEVLKGTTSMAAASQWGGALKDHKWKILETSSIHDDKRARESTKSR